MFFLTEDLVVEILARVSDYRCLIQCSLVCKRWFSLIFHSQYFRGRCFHHHNENKSQSSLPCTLLFRDCHSYDFDSPKCPSYDLFSKASKILHGQSSTSSSSSKYLDFLGWQNPIIRASDKDLLLVQRTLQQFYVCNPLTKQSVALPEAPPCNVKHVSYGFVCESNSNTTSITGSIIKYRVVLLTLTGPLVFRRTIFSFSSEKGEWKESKFPFPFLRIQEKRAVAYNGVIYWQLLFTYEQWELIMGFDPFEEVEKKAWRLIRFPEGYGCGTEQQTSGETCIGVVRGRLRLWQSFRCRERLGEFTLKAWERSLSHDTWLLVKDVAVKLSAGLFSEIMNVICLHPEDGDVFFFSHKDADYEDEGRGIYKYRIGEDSCFGKVCDFMDVTHRPVCNIRVFPLVHPWLPTKIPALPCIERVEPSYLRI
ncbi:F-box domain containing protein [Trema orientale]|uniref:F-box domain containing protein n=1 Tax=Trema orientale TaxID=63057 RepID=A0A2P5FVC8_TREOI|nr:F-box domain containing protein [Trema orientale]